MSDSVKIAWNKTVGAFEFVYPDGRVEFAAPVLASEAECEPGHIDDLARYAMMSKPAIYASHEEWRKAVNAQVAGKSILEKMKAWDAALDEHRAYLAKAFGAGRAMYAKPEKFTVRTGAGGTGEVRVIPSQAAPAKVDLRERAHRIANTAAKAFVGASIRELIKDCPVTSPARMDAPDPFSMWPKCHACSEKAGKYVPVQRYTPERVDAVTDTFRVKVECHGKKWTHTVEAHKALYRDTPYAFFAPGFDHD